MPEFGDLVKAVNQGLKAEKAGVSIRQRRNKLSLRAVLPHKDGSNREVQYDVPTGCDATKAGLNRAKTLAVKLSTEKKLGSFSWDAWIESGETHQKPEEPAQSQTIDAWTARFKLTGTKSATSARPPRSLKRSEPGLVSRHRLRKFLTRLIC